MAKTLEQLQAELAARPWYKDIRYWPWRAWHRVRDRLDRLKWAWQRAYRGYDDTAYWALDSYIAEIALPVIKFLRDEGSGHPGTMTEEEWKLKLSKMIIAFELIREDDLHFDTWEANEPLVAEGLALFGKHFRNLWN